MDRTRNHEQITKDSRIREVISHHPGTGAIFIQHGRLYRPAGLYAGYDPPLTVSEYAQQNGLDESALLAALHAAVGAEEMERLFSWPSPGGGRDYEARRLPARLPRYTATYEERGQAEMDEVVSVLESRGPE